MDNTLSQAINFSLDVQQETQKGECLREAILKTLKDYPDAKIGDDIEFQDGSKAISTSEGFRIE